MKKRVILAASLFTSLTGFAQGNTKPQSPAESFAARKEIILEKRYDQVGKIGHLNVQLEYLKDIGSSEKMQCIRFDIQSQNNVPGPSALLDSNEVNGIISFLKFINTSVVTRPPVDPNTEISFTTKYNVQIGCYWQATRGWIIFLRTDTDSPSSEAEFALADMNSLQKTLNLAVEQMKRY